MHIGLLKGLSLARPGLSPLSDPVVVSEAGIYQERAIFVIRCQLIDVAGIPKT
jgi:hypothetical protein